LLVSNAATVIVAFSPSEYTPPGLSHANSKVAAKSGAAAVHATSAANTFKNLYPLVISLPFLSVQWPL
jgi:hypothetical protein